MSAPTLPDAKSGLTAIIKNLPGRPGVYLLMDARGNLLYVGKAQSLGSRVRSYWQKESGGYEHHLIRSVIDRVADLEYTITRSPRPCRSRAALRARPRFRQPQRGRQ